MANLEANHRGKVPAGQPMEGGNAGGPGEHHRHARRRSGGDHQQPELYVKYLDMQGDNPTYSAGNIALVMFQDPEATVFGTAERWKTLNRGVNRPGAKQGSQNFCPEYPGPGVSPHGRL